MDIWTKDARVRLLQLGSTYKKFSSCTVYFGCYSPTLINLNRVGKLSKVSTQHTKHLFTSMTAAIVFLLTCLSTSLLLLFTLFFFTFCQFFNNNRIIILQLFLLILSFSMHFFSLNFSTFFCLSPLLHLPLPPSSSVSRSSSCSLLPSQIKSS